MVTPIKVCACRVGVARPIGDQKFRFEHITVFLAGGVPPRVERATTGLVGMIYPRWDLRCLVMNWDIT